MHPQIVAHGMTFNVIITHLMSLPLILVAVKYMVQYMDANSSLFCLKHLQKALIFLITTSVTPKSHQRLVSFHSWGILTFLKPNLFFEIPQPVSHMSKLLSLDLCSTFYSPDAINLLSLKASSLRILIQNSTNVAKLLDFWPFHHLYLIYLQILLLCNYSLFAIVN